MLMVVGVALLLGEEPFAASTYYGEDEPCSQQNAEPGEEERAQLTVVAAE